MKTALERLQVGQRVKGVVSSLANYGAFVDLGGVDGLLHVSEIRWERTDKPELGFVHTDWLGT